jgi:chromate reductase
MLSAATRSTLLSSAPNAALLFPALSSSQIARIASHGVIRPIVRGDVLIESGQTDVPFFVVKIDRHFVCPSRAGGPLSGGVMENFNIVGFAGSLRRGSYNRALLRAAAELAPSALHIVIHELDGIPLYNGDIEAVGAPPSVVRLRDAIRKADGLLIATPEYNYGVPGVLKNTIDWLSRPPGDSALNGTVAAVMGASLGITGTARSQLQLRQAFVFTNTHALLQPEVLVGLAHEKFDADGRLVHQATRDVLATFLHHFTELIALHAMAMARITT